jgi:hypothetical protein
MSPLDPIAFFGMAAIFALLLLIQRWTARLRLILALPVSGYFLWAAYTATSTGGKIGATVLAVLPPGALAVQAWRERRRR